jgi:hypothetical protein
LPLSKWISFGKAKGRAESEARPTEEVEDDFSPSLSVGRTMIEVVKLLVLLVLLVLLMFVPSRNFFRTSCALIVMFVSYILFSINLKKALVK